MVKFLQSLFKSRNERQIRKYQSVVVRINALTDDYRALDDAALCAKTQEFIDRVRDGEVLEALLPEAFATIKEAADRRLNMRHFDVQLIGGMVLNDGKIAEMRTGEGKTLVATLPAYLNVLGGFSVHIVTVNDYLAKRDAEWMGKIYEFLGLTVGVIVSGQTGEERKQAYGADIVYGTNNEFGFDYLRDNMVLTAEHRVQRGRHFAIVDEVDSILIDEARTPLIISGPSDDASEMYVRINQIVKQLKPEIREGDDGDYALDEKSKQVFLTEAGHQKIENILAQAGLLKGSGSLYDLTNIDLLHHVNAALRAQALFKKNVDYLVKNNEVLIVDEFTGRVMSGRRWGEGLHQAVEAKENVPIKSENQTLASITFQNYFRLYERLSGMTGTADTEAYEFQEIYGLEVIIIPTHRKMIRNDMGDLVYMTAAEKFEAIIEDIKDCVARGQPVLVGTASIETSEFLSSLLNKERITHQVLNAKQHEAESHIIANAGQPGTVTIATNMAGRGTDIVLGGALKEIDDIAQVELQKQRHQQVVSAGGLHIIGTERHESRRIDNQLRGRSGRQGDPGSSRFYLSLEDNLLRIFAGDKVRGLMEKLGVEYGESIEHPWVSRAIENAQRKVEAHNFDIRKNLLEYDDVANEQRKVIYGQRDELLDSESVDDNVQHILPEVFSSMVKRYIPVEGMEWDSAGLEQDLKNNFAMDCSVGQWIEHDDSLSADGVAERITRQAWGMHVEASKKFGESQIRVIEKILMLQTLDYHWKEHLLAMDHLRQGIGLRGFAQKNPRQEYKRESFEMFETLLERIRYFFIAYLLRIRIAEEPPAQKNVSSMEKVTYRHSAAEDALHLGTLRVGDGQMRRKTPVRRIGSGMAMSDQAQTEAPIEKVHTIKRRHPKVGRNEPCFCGSGKKYKKCHGKDLRHDTSN